MPLETRIDKLQNHIFISYASEELSTASEICKIFEELGIKCWLARRELTPGSEFSKEIIQAIKSAKALIILISKKSNESRHVHTELATADDLKKYIIPLRIEKIQPSDEVLFFVKTKHIIDYWESDFEIKAYELATKLTSEVSLKPFKKNIYFQIKKKIKYNKYYILLVLFPLLLTLQVLYQEEHKEIDNMKAEISDLDKSDINLTSIAHPKLEVNQAPTFTLIVTPNFQTVSSHIANQLRYEMEANVDGEFLFIPSKSDGYSSAHTFELSFSSIPSEFRIFVYDQNKNKEGPFYYKMDLNSLFQVENEKFQKRQQEQRTSLKNEFNYRVNEKFKCSYFQYTFISICGFKLPPVRLKLFRKQLTQSVLATAPLH